MRTWMIGCLIGTLALTSIAPGAEFSVAPEGSDDGPGTLARPFATIGRAQRAAQPLAGKEPVTINLRAGTHYMSESLVLTPDDSGTAEMPVVYRASPGESVRLSGGRRLQLEWEKHQGDVMKAKVDRALLDRLAFDQLFVNGLHRPMARFPNHDPNAYVFGGVTSFDELCRRASGWKSPATGFLHAIHRNRWGSMHYRITSFDASQRTLVLEGGWQQNRAADFHRNQVMVEHVFEELDAPGEWYLDRNAATLYFWPPAGTRLETAVIETADLKELVLFEGTPERPVRHVRIEGLELVHAARTFLEPYEPLLRGDWSICRLAAVRMHGTEDCSIRNCYFNQLGGNGLFFDRYNRRSEVTGSRFHKLGESGVCFVGNYDAVRSGPITYGNDWPEDQFDPVPGPRGEDYPKDCRVHDCLVYNIGRTGKQTAGVLISMSESITVSHATIFSVPRSGITINDGCWGGHTLEHNDVFDTVIETGDHGPFNSWGRDRYWRTEHHGTKPYHDPEDAKGQKLAKTRARLDNHKPTVIRNNRFWHAGGHTWGVDLDDGSSNYHILDNLTLGCGLKLREGFFRRVENNIFLDTINVHVCFDRKSDVFERNIVAVSDGRPIYQGIRAKPLDADAWDHNLYWARDGGPIEFVPGANDPRLAGVKTMTFEQWQAAGLDEHSLVADPRFVDPARHDYRVSPDSPAVALGFKNFPMDRFGVLSPNLQALAEWGHRTANGYLDPETLRKREAAVETPARKVEPRSDVMHDFFGARVKNMTTEAEMSAVGIGRVTGVLLLDVPADSVAGQAGFVRGDCILKIDGQPVHVHADLIEFLKTARGKRVKILIDGNPLPRHVELRVP